MCIRWTHYASSVVVCNIHGVNSFDHFKVIVILRNEKIEMLNVSDLIGKCDLRKARPIALHIFHKNDKNSCVSGTEI